jgi:hypothetical protein
LFFFADENPQRAVEARTRVMQQHADSDTVFFPAHFGGTSAGRIKRDGSVFRYEFRAS